MNNDIIKKVSEELSINDSQVEKTLKLLEEGNTIPFIARYRKEVTSGLDEVQIRQINEFYMYEVNLLKRKEDVIRLIDEKGLLTEKIEKEIMNAKKLVEVEDIYRPYKEKKKTKATSAIKNGLEPLAKQIMSYTTKNIKELTSPFINENVKDENEALAGACYIIAEWISDNAYIRKWIRSYTFNTGFLVSKLKKDANDENKIYKMYYDFSERIKYAKSHRIMAMNRGEREKILNVSISVDKDRIISFIEEKTIKKEAPLNYLIKDSIKDSFKRLIFPSIEREIRNELTENAEDESTLYFSENLECLLMQPPMKDKIILGFDPAYRTGCKLAVIDETGKKIDIKVIYPHPPKNEKEKSKKILLELINKYNIDLIAIGNGTASRESEQFVADVLRNSNVKTKYVIVNEAGASIYSASDLAIAEFPELHVEERSAISIARRLQDPLSELVKIDPESIGVGLYQHDVPQKKLSSSLNFIVEKAVNSVGVNVNTASFRLLSYVSGLTKSSISKIIDYRNKYGKIENRSVLSKILSPKAYTQSIGFLRIIDGNEILDSTSIHPESYPSTIKFLENLNINKNDIGNIKISVNVKEEADKLNIDVYTLEDIISSLQKPNRDPRDEIAKPILRSDVLHIEDLKMGMSLEGTVRNVTPFGAFIDIGLKNDALVHISKLGKKNVEHPMEVLKIGDIVTCYVDEINNDENMVSLSLVGGEK